MAKRTIIIKLWLLTCFLWGQTTTITGLVIDQRTGDPLIGANVILTGDNLTTGAAADIEGRYLLLNISPGDYELKISYIGYKIFKKSFTIDTGETTLTLDAPLSVSAIQLQEYIVTARRGKREKITDAAAAISIISELKIRNASNPNLGDYFKNIKGVDFTASGLDSYNLSARGFNSSFSSRLLTLTDGRMANVPSLRLIAYNTIPLTSDDIKQIEVVLGPSSALYGPNAHSGVINIISKRPKESVGTVAGITTGTRQFNKVQARHAGTIGNLGYKMSFVNFSAYDWEYIELEERKNHLKPWATDQGRAGDILDDLFDKGQARWDDWDIYVDLDGDGVEDTVYTKEDNLVKDRNQDGLNDLPNFNIRNRRFDIRLDYDFSQNHFISANFGQAKATNINITGIGRYGAYDWTYRFYQLRWIYNNWFAQAYVNTSNSGSTRNLRTGEVIKDHSTFFHFQFQHSLDFSSFFNTKLIWGGDYQRTMPETYGTILPDGTGGRNPVSFGRDGKDNDGDGKIDELDELIITNEYGIYVQSQSKLSDHFELILAGRLDLHDGQLDKNGLTFLGDPLAGGTVKYFPQWSPKLGLLWKPRDNQTFRLTAARAFNTPSSQGLYLDVLAAIFSVFPVKARGNANGYNFIHDPEGNLLMFDVRALTDTEFMLTKMPDSSVLYIPAVLGRPGQFVDVEDYTKIKPISSEEIWTYEVGYSGFLNNRVRASFDLYYSTYSDFVSDLTWITPVVLDTSGGFYSVDNPDPPVLGFIPTGEHSGVSYGTDGIPGTEDDKRDFDSPVNLLLTNINYGKISLWGFDASLYAFLTENITADLNISYLGKTQFWNFLTKDYDPINAPQYKINAQLAYNAPKGFTGNVGFRYIPTFKWAAGVHFGEIPSYLVLDSMVAYKFSDRYTLLLNVNNLTDNYHREIIGGPKMGRHITLKINVSM